MTKKLIILALVIILPTIAGAAVFKANNEVNLNQETISENVYLAGGTINSSSAISGDILAAGGSIMITGSTTDDVFLAGGTVDVGGKVGGDLRLLGGNTTIRNVISGDALIAAGQVRILPEGQIDGDLTLAAGASVLDGVVHGTASLNGGEITINGHVDGDLTVRAQHLIIGGKAVINGKLVYYSANRASIDPGAKIKNGIDYQITPGPRNSETNGRAFGATLIWAVFRFFMLWFAALILGAVWGAGASRSVARTITSFWPRLGWGLVIFVATPILAAILFITVIGIPLGLSVLSLYFSLLVLAYIYTAIIAGSWLNKQFRRKTSYEINWQTSALGSLALLILSLIPIVGWIARLVIFLLSIGAVGVWFYNLMREEQKEI